MVDPLGDLTVGERAGFIEDLDYLFLVEDPIADKEGRLECSSFFPALFDIWVMGITV